MVSSKNKRYEGSWQASWVFLIWLVQYILDLLEFATIGDIFTAWLHSELKGSLSVVVDSPRCISKSVCDSPGNSSNKNDLQLTANISQQ